MIEIAEKDGAVTFLVRVQPGSRRNGIEGEWQGALKVRLMAPPVEGRANDARRELLAERLNIPISAVRIVAGARSRTKRVAVSGVSLQQIRALVPGLPH